MKWKEKKQKTKQKKLLATEYKQDQQHLNRVQRYISVHFFDDFVFINRATFLSMWISFTFHSFALVLFLKMTINIHFIYIFLLLLLNGIRFQSNNNNNKMNSILLLLHFSPMHWNVVIITTSSSMNCRRPFYFQ